MIRRSIFVAVVAPALLLGACHGPARLGSNDPVDVATIARGEGYALLYSTVKDECDVDKVLIIKRPNARIAEVIKAIGQFSRTAKGNLEMLAKEEPPFALDRQGLPEAEAQTREAISSSTSKKILLAGGKDLEFELLMTQHEALNYESHLARVLEKREVRENRQRFLTQFVKEAESLHERVVGLMKEPYVGQGK